MLMKKQKIDSIDNIQCTMSEESTVNSLKTWRNEKEISVENRTQKMMKMEKRSLLKQNDIYLDVCSRKKKKNRKAS